MLLTTSDQNHHTTQALPTNNDIKHTISARGI